MNVGKKGGPKGRKGRNSRMGQTKEKLLTHKNS